MTARFVPDCSLLDRYLDGDLDRDTAGAFERHVSGCAACRRAVEDMCAIRDTLRAGAERSMPDDADLRIRSSLHAAIGRTAPARAVMDLEEAARFLGISIPDLVNLMDQLPAFELGGRVRFNRDQLIKWMNIREKTLSWQKRRDASDQETKVIEFPGGSTG